MTCNMVEGKEHISSSNMSGFWCGFWLATALDILRGEPTGMLLAGEAHGQCCNAVTTGD